MRAVIPPPTTSRCWIRRWSRCRRPTGPGPDNPHGAARMLIRSDSAGATHGFAAACRDAEWGSPWARSIDAPVRDAAEVLNSTEAWYPAIDSDGGIRDGRLGRRGHRPGRPVGMARRHPADPAQGTPTSRRAVEVHRHRRAPDHRISHRHRRRRDPGQLAGLELRHRQHARVEDRIREAKATGLRNLPFNAFDANAAWLEIIMAATDLIAWTKLIGFTDHPDLARCEIHDVPLPGPARRRPHHPRRPTNPAAHRRHLALGTRHRHRLEPHPRRVHLTPRSLSPRDERPTGLGKARPPARQPATCHTPMPQSRPPAGPEPGSPALHQAARKIEVSYTLI